jgi:hypothetical protein
MSEADYRMQTIPINNPELIEILDDYRKAGALDGFEKYMHLTCSDVSDKKDWFTGEEYLKEIIAQGDRHEGFPDAMYGYEFRVNTKLHKFFKNDNAKSSDEARFRSEFMKLLTETNTKMINFMGCRNNALSAAYPKDGFIAWHNNANAAAWNMIFTYSETGDGCFKYWDIEKGEIVVMQDVPGWQLKAGYFGSYGEEDKIFYHAAETNCWRQTVSFCFDTSPVAQLFREEIIDEIMSE